MTEEELRHVERDCSCGRNHKTEKEGFCYVPALIAEVRRLLGNLQHFIRAEATWKEAARRASEKCAQLSELELIHIEAERTLAIKNENLRKVIESAPDLVRSWASTRRVRHENQLFQGRMEGEQAAYSQIATLLRERLKP